MCRDYHERRAGPESYMTEDEVAGMLQTQRSRAASARRGPEVLAEFNFKVESPLTVR